ncbi:MAG: hypothetical protein U0R76_17540 [Candidatus Nanopelagicales bacterium]
MTTVLRTLIDPFRLTAALSLRATRYAALLIARSSRRWEALVEHALAEPVLLRGWEGASRAATPPRHPSRGDAVVDLTHDDLADWAPTAYSTASARASELQGEDLRALLDYEQAHGHRLRFVQLLRRRLDDEARSTG